MNYLIMYKFYAYWPYKSVEFFYLLQKYSEITAKVINKNKDTTFSQNNLNIVIWDKFCKFCCVQQFQMKAKPIVKKGIDIP